VKGKKDVQNNIGRNNLLVEDNPGYFSVTGSLAANGFVAWVINMAPAIANLYIAYATKLHKARI
jgi:hypothetical protein